MTTAHNTDERPILPPTASAPRADIAHLQALVSAGPARLKLSNGEDQVTLPDELVDALRQALAALARGQAVTILPTATLLTTQQAADILGVSRPTFIKMLEAGEIPYLTPGRHRRVQLTEVLAYQRRSATETSQALDDLMQDSAEFYAAASPTDDAIRTR